MVLQHTELLGFSTIAIVRYSKQYKQDQQDLSETLTISFLRLSAGENTYSVFP
jgi:hypothetical protein